MQGNHVPLRRLDALCNCTASKMTIELLIHAIVRQTTVLIAQLATSRGVRAPLAQIADQVFIELAREIERQGVSKKVSADMFGLGLRTYRRKIQRLSESSTERGRSLWEIVLEHIRTQHVVTRREILARFPNDDEAQVRSVIRDLCEGQLVFWTGSGSNPSYRAASDDELSTLQRKLGAEGAEELVVALMYREGPLTLLEIAERAQTEVSALESTIQQLLADGRIQVSEANGVTRYSAQALVVPLGAAVGWEAAVFDHFKALVTTILTRLNENRATALGDRVGGGTYTIDVWPGHPMEEEVFGTLARLRSALSEMRERVVQFNGDRPIPEEHTRVVIYAGQCLTHEDGDSEEYA